MLGWATGYRRVEVRRSSSFYSAYGYTGEYSGDSTDLVYLRARYYLPELGRFLTKDTWDGNPAEPISLNDWIYVNGNPINLSDPTG